jgi:hypothetical protein
MDRVANVEAAEVIEPTLQKVLYKDDATCLWRGCAISVAKSGAAVWDVPTPKPPKTRRAKKAQWLETAIWSIDAIITIEDPMPTHHFLPNLSATYDAGVNDMKAPSEVAAMRRPTIFGLRPPMMV